MLPYLNIPTFSLGPLTLHIWGFAVSIGFLIALWIAYRRAKRSELNANVILDLGFWILIGAFICARLFHVFFYEWGYYETHLSEIIRIDKGGLSSFGGFIGAAVAFLVYSKYVIASGAKQSPEIATARLRSSLAMTRMRYADVLMYAWPFGHGIGRIGCFLVHMHPGRLSNTPWTVAYPAGARLDMGLIESAALLSYGIIIWLATRKCRMRTGFYLIFGMIFYGTLRFVLDFFRATDLPMSDARYFGLTPAQYGSIVLVVGGIIAWQRLHKRANVI